MVYFSILIRLKNFGETLKKIPLFRKEGLGEI